MQQTIDAVKLPNPEAYPHPELPRKITNENNKQHSEGSVTSDTAGELYLQEFALFTQRHTVSSLTDYDCLHSKNTTILDEVPNCYVPAGS